MRSGLVFWACVLLVRVAAAQTSEAELTSKIAGVRYAPIAEAARIQGDVHLHLAPGGVSVLSGHPLLAPIAAESAKSFTPVQGEADLDVTYHFVLADTGVIIVPTPVTVRRGNALERAILRVFGRRTERVVIEYQCQAAPPANRVTLSPTAVDIWIFGVPRPVCLQPETARLVAGR